MTGDDYETVSEDEEDGVHEGDADVRAFVNPPAEESPVVPLGYHGDLVTFAMDGGEIRHVPAARIRGMLKTDIYRSIAGQGFLNYWRDPKEDRIKIDAAAIWFNRACTDAGLWDPTRPERSLGVWPGGLGEVILHRGSELVRYVGGQAHRQSIIEALRGANHGPLYRLRPPAPEPTDPSSTADGAWVVETLGLWRFELIGDEGLTGGDVVAGFIMCSLLGAFAPFRVHVLIDAMGGSGKTTLMLFVQALLSALAGEVIDNFTEAGLRAALSGQARPTLLDEAEASAGEAGFGAVERVISLMRRMSTGKGSDRRQGQADGSALAQTAVGAVMMAAINPPRLGPADASRMVQVRLLPLTGQLATDEQLAVAGDKARRLAPALLGRALAGAHRYTSDLAMMKAAFTADGQRPRGADLLAALAVGRRLLISDAPLTPGEARDEAVFWTPLIETREASEVVSNEGADALMHLFSWSSGQHARDRVLTLGEIIQSVTKGGDHDDVLHAHGLRFHHGVVRKGGDAIPWLIVANDHPGLKRIFDRTRWQDPRRTLKYIDEMGPEYLTVPTERPMRFGPGYQRRGIAIPLAPWIDGLSGRRTARVPSDVPEEDIDFDG